MASISASPVQIRSLYRSLVRSSRLFSAYNFRAYVHRRTRDAFREHQFESDPVKIQQLYTKGLESAAVARRQGIIQSQYNVVPNLVIETPSVNSTILKGVASPSD